MKDRTYCAFRMNLYALPEDLTALIREIVALLEAFYALPDDIYALFVEKYTLLEVLYTLTKDFAI